jgi:hypothetical protein
VCRRGGRETADSLTLRPDSLTLFSVDKPQDYNIFRAGPFAGAGGEASRGLGRAAAAGAGAFGCRGGPAPESVNESQGRTGAC